MPDQTFAADIPSDPSGTGVPPASCGTGVSPASCGTGVSPVRTVSGPGRNDTLPPRARKRAVRAALRKKEWLEQRWRFLLGTVVLSGLLAGMLRAQIIPSNEAALIIYWPVGVLMTVFLAMGPVAAERADRTWAFLVAQPVSRADVLLAKWRAGLWQIVGIMAIATTAGALALWSRGFRVMPEYFDSEPVSETSRGLLSTWLPGDDSAWARAFSVLRSAHLAHPILWLGIVGVVSTVALVCWYTPLFFVLSRARNEFAAGLGGILLTIAAHVWLAQFLGVAIGSSNWLLLPALFNPLAPLVLIWLPETLIILPVLMAVHILVWIVLPCAVVRRVARKAVSR